MGWGQEAPHGQPVARAARSEALHLVFRAQGIRVLGRGSQTAGAEGGGHRGCPGELVHAPFTTSSAGPSGWTHMYFHLQNKQPCHHSKTWCKAAMIAVF